MRAPVSSEKIEAFEEEGEPRTEASEDSVLEWPSPEQRTGGADHCPRWALELAGGGQGPKVVAAA